MVLLVGTSSSVAAVLPAPPATITLPAHAANAYGVSLAYGPTNGLLYVWDGAQVKKQDGFNSNSFTSIGNVGSGSADPGPIAFSNSGSQLLVGNGFGGVLSGANSGLIFGIPTAGGSSSTAVGNVALHNAFLGAPIAGSDTKYFIDQGTDFSGSASAVTIFDSADGSNTPLINNIPGASSSLALDGTGGLYVGIGYGDFVGELRRFSLASWTIAYNTSTPLDWSAGQGFNVEQNNSGAGMAVDARGYLFAGGPQGITVFDTQGHGRLYDNGGYSTATYDPANDRVLVTGYGNFQGIYPASLFTVPEPSTALLALLGLLVLPLSRRMRRH